jgi:hypothetical protein
MTQNGGDTVITLGADILTIHNLTPGQLQASDFGLA